MAGWFGPGGLNNDPGASLTGGNQEDPQQAAIRQYLLRNFPGLAGLAGGAPQAPNTPAAAGYTFPGVQFYNGQQFGGGLPSLSLFEGTGGGSAPDSLTGAIATGQARSSSIQPLGSGGSGVVSAPQLQLPTAPDLPSFADTGDTGTTTTMGPSSSSSSGPASAEIGSLGQAAGLAFKLGSGLTSTPDLGTGADLSSPALQQQRAGERTDYTNATGSPSGVPQGSTSWQLPAGTTQNQLSPEQINAMLTDWTNGMRGGSLPSAANLSSFVEPASIGGLLNTPSQGAAALGDLNAAGQEPVGSALDFLNQYAGGGQLPGSTSWTGLGMGGLSTLGGLANTVGGIQSGNIVGAGLGGLQTIGGLTSMLQSSPQLLNMIASQVGVSGQGLSGALGGVGGAVGTVGGLYSLYQGIQTGDPLQIATGLVSAYQGGSALAGQILGQALPSITSALTTGIATIAPEAAMSIATAFGGEAAAAAAQAALEAGATAVEATSAALSTAVGGVAGAAAPIIMAIVSYFQAADEMRIRHAGFTNNPIAGQLYSNATAGVKSAQDVFNALNSGGDLSTVPTMSLADAISQMSQGLLPYYATAEGGAGVLRPSSTVTGGGLFENTGQGPAAIADYTQKFTNAQQGLVSIVNELLKRGVPYEEIGALPVTNDFGLQTNDMSNPASYFYGQNAGKWNAEANRILQQAEASPLLQRTGLNGEMLMLPNPNYMPGSSGDGLSSQVFNPSDWTPEALFSAAAGAAGAAPDAITHAGGLQSGMYGGPIWQALARMGGGTGPGAVGDQIWNAISQHFDPWVNARTETPNQILATMGLPVDVTADALAQGAQPGVTNVPGQAYQAPWDPYWSNLINQGAQQATTQTQQSFADLQSQLQNYLSQLQAAGVPGMPIQPTAPTASAVPADWAAQFAAMTPTQQAQMRAAGLDPSMIGLNWLPATA